MLSEVTVMLEALGNTAALYLTKIIGAIVVWLVGKWIISKLLSVLTKSGALEKLDPSLRTFASSAVRILLYIILIVTIIGVLGVPMASVITILASAGVAVGMSLQGALGNLAGGIMLMIFRPFGVGDYISAAGGEGTVKEITLFYTSLITVDNKKITIPNGSLMNANVVNFSAEATRRVDLTFSVAKGEDIAKITGLMLDVMNSDEKVLKDPTPFARLSGGSNEAMEFTLRAWVNSADYWDTYFNLTQKVTQALGDAGVKAPAVRIVNN